MLPIVELAVLPIAVIHTRTMEINILNYWQTYLAYFIFTWAMIGTLVVTLVKEIERKIKIAIRIIILMVLGFILTWGLLQLNN